MRILRNLSGFAKIIPYLLVAALLVGAYYLFLYKPLTEERQQLQTEITRSQEEVRELEADLDDIAGLRAEIDHRQQELSDLLELELYESEEALEFLYESIEKSGLEVRDEAASSSDEGYFYTLSLRGDYQSFYELLTQIDEADFRYHLENFFMSSHDDSLHMLLNLSFYQWEALEYFSEMETGR